MGRRSEGGGASDNDGTGTRVEIVKLTSRVSRTEFRWKVEKRWKISWRCRSARDEQRPTGPFSRQNLVLDTSTRGVRRLQRLCGARNMCRWELLPGSIGRRNG